MADVDQVMCTYMLGKAEGYALSLLDQYEAASWPAWEDETVGARDS